MLIDSRHIESLLRRPGQPETPVKLDRINGELRSVTSDELSYPVVLSQPVLIDFADSIISRDWFNLAHTDYSIIGHRQSLPRIIKSYLVGTSAICNENFRKFRNLIKSKQTSRPLLLMIGSATRGIGTDILYDDPDIDQISFDVYPSPLTHFVADAHKIPLPDHSIDAVCIQAVLEHVLEPSVVVSEIFRVLKTDGLVYAETPFMQQIHEGAYDFTRFTELGHRWLWRNFAAIERGAMGGPGLSLFWAAKYFFRGLTRHRRLADILSAPFMIFGLFDRLISRKYQIDGANGVYFLGKKSEGAADTNTIARQYLGAQ
ncbi:MAG: class I SAM-dependent methyltransferase [Parvibaculum sp.]|nr:class I SAM-dependent methyltransferase [Parvibaculum sp.]